MMKFYLLRCVSLLLACAVKRRRFPVGATFRPVKGVSRSSDTSAESGGAAADFISS